MVSFPMKDIGKRNIYIPCLYNLFIISVKNIGKRNIYIYIPCLYNLLIISSKDIGKGNILLVQFIHYMNEGYWCKRNLACTIYSFYQYK